MRSETEMKIASEIKTRQDLDELKTIMEIFVVNNRVRELAAQSTGNN